MTVHNCRSNHQFFTAFQTVASTKGELMKKILVIVACVLCSATTSIAQDKCLTEGDVQNYVKQHRMVETRCYWNSDTAGSEEEFQCVRTWVSPQKKYFSVENRFGCLVNPRTHSQAEMKRLLKIKKPVPPCDDCG